MPCVVPAGVFDAWSWCASDVVEWRTPRARDELAGGAIDGSNPPDLAFVMHAECTFLPRELAALHLPGQGFTTEWALAPYAIDDATDLLFERRVRPRDVLSLAAGSLPALVWGLHDWAHFHNHGPFDQPAMTELQCDLLALHWLRANRRAAGASDEDVARVARDLAALTRRRFAAEGLAPPPDVESLFAAPYPAAPIAGLSGPRTSS
jgi:hypothetical protein